MSSVIDNSSKNKQRVGDIAKIILKLLKSKILHSKCDSQSTLSKRRNWFTVHALSYAPVTNYVWASSTMTCTEPLESLMTSAL